MLRRLLGRGRPGTQPADTAAGLGGDVVTDLGRTAVGLGVGAADLGGRSALQFTRTASRAGAFTVGLGLRATVSALEQRTLAGGMTTGTVLHIGARRTDKVSVDVINYAPDTYTVEAPAVDTPGWLVPPARGVRWIRVAGLHDVPVVTRLADELHLHPLFVAGVLDTTQRPRIEEIDEATLISLRLPSWSDEQHRLEAEQVSLIVHGETIVTFQESDAPIFAAVEGRLRGGRGQLRAGSAAYLVHALVDAIVDAYFPVLDRLGQRIEDLEDQMDVDSSAGVLQRVHALRRELIFVRNSAWPLREVVGRLTRADSNLAPDEIQPYLEESHTHAVEVMELTELFRDLVDGMVDRHLSNVSNRTNEIMKVLTIMASVFIPLTFVAGIYGMNFQHMPGLQAEAAFWILIAVMAGVTVGMLGLFRLRRWI